MRNLLHLDLAPHRDSSLFHILGALDNVCQAEPPIRQAPVVLVREWLGHELRLEQEFSETVGVPGEMMSRSG